MSKFTIKPTNTVTTLIKGDYGFEPIKGRRFQQKFISLRNIGGEDFIYAYVHVSPDYVEDDNDLKEYFESILGDTGSYVSFHRNYAKNNDEEEENEFSIIAGYFCILPKVSFDLLVANNDPEKYVLKTGNRFILGSHIFRAKTRMLHVSLPSEFSGDYRQMENILKKYLENFVNIGLLKESEYEINVLKKTQEFDDEESVSFYSAMIISFEKEVPALTIQAIRLILHNNEFVLKNPVQNRYSKTNVRYIRCTWYDPGAALHDAELMTEIQEVFKKLGITDSKKEVQQSAEPSIISPKAEESVSRNSRKNKNTPPKKNFIVSAAAEKVLANTTSAVPAVSAPGSYAAIAAGAAAASSTPATPAVSIPSTPAVSAAPAVISEMNRPRLLRLEDGTLMVLLPDGTLSKVTSMS